MGNWRAKVKNAVPKNVFDNILVNKHMEGGDLFRRLYSKLSRKESFSRYCYYCYLHSYRRPKPVIILRCQN